MSEKNAAQKKIHQTFWQKAIFSLLGKIQNSAKSAPIKADALDCNTFLKAMVRHKDELLKKRAKLAYEINYFVRTELGLESFYQMVGQSLFLFIAKTQTPTEVVTSTIRDVSGDGLISVLILSLMWSFARSILSNNRQRFVPSIENIERAI